MLSIALSSALALAVLAPAAHAQTATPGGPRAEDKATIKADREKIKQDREQLKKDREKLRADRRALHRKGRSSVKPAPKPQS